MRSRAFSKRTLTELLRDPLSYIFCVIFPLVMLVIMTAINSSIPAQANMTVFKIEKLAPGIASFGLTFVMLFTALQVSKDRSTAFLIRLYASPMKSKDFITGYTYPFVLIAVFQYIITSMASVIIGYIVGYNFSIINLLIGLIVMVPSMFLYIGFGLLFAVFLSEKAAPGICSVIIATAGMLGGIWMDVDAIGGTLADICRLLPFYHGVKASRMAVVGNYSNIWSSLFIILIYSFAIYLLAVLIFKRKMQSDVK